MIIVVRAREEDLERILSIQRAAFTSEAEFYGDFTISPLHQTLEELRAEFKAKILLKAIVDQKLLGSVRVSLSGTACLVERLVVDPAAQKRGVGSALLAAAEAIYSEARTMELFTGAKSEWNIRFYEKRGYARFPEESLSGKVPLVCMRKRPQATR